VGVGGSIGGGCSGLKFYFIFICFVSSFFFVFSFLFNMTRPFAFGIRKSELESDKNWKRVKILLSRR
jgi:hypothetical protein